MEGCWFYPDSDDGDGGVGDEGDVGGNDDHYFESDPGCNEDVAGLVVPLDLGMGTGTLHLVCGEPWHSQNHHYRLL